MSRVLVVGPTRLYRDALTQALASTRWVTTVGSAAGVEEAVAQVRELRPSVVLVDLPLLEGHRLIRLLNGIRIAAKLVAIAVPETEDDVIGWAEAGASGCITRDSPLAELPDLLKGVERGELLCSSHAAGLLFGHVKRLAAGSPRQGPAPRLTRREAQILRLVAQGLSNKEIARALCIELPTVKNHLHHIFEKLRIQRRAEAAAWARAYGPDPHPAAATGTGVPRPPATD